MACHRDFALTVDLHPGEMPPEPAAPWWHCCVCGEAWNESREYSRAEGQGKEGNSPGMNNIGDTDQLPPSRPHTHTQTYTVTAPPPPPDTV